MILIDKVKFKLFYIVYYGDITQVGITVKSNLGSNSDIDNRSDPDFVLLRMLSGRLHQRFNYHLADQRLKTDGVLHAKTT